MKLKRAGGFRTLLLTCLFTISYKIKIPEVKHRSNILHCAGLNLHLKKIGNSD